MLKLKWDDCQTDFMYKFCSQYFESRNVNFHNDYPTPPTLKKKSLRQNTKVKNTHAEVKKSI